MHVNECTVPFQTSVKYLGVRLDQTLSMHDHISSVCRAAYLELRRISTMRPFLTDSATARLVSATVTSKLDYSNSVLAGFPMEQISRLQRVQNSAARLVLRKRKRDHLMPLFHQLHWLPVKSRIQYKLAVMSYRLFDKTLPPYLSAALSVYHPPRTLRSSSEKLLHCPNRNLKTAGDRSFSSQAPCVWNSLPISLRNAQSLSIFKRNLKTHLFRQAFPEVVRL